MLMVRLTQSIFSLGTLCSLAAVKIRLDVHRQDHKQVSFREEKIIVLKTCQYEEIKMK
jgi:hypothetical protein